MTNVLHVNASVNCPHGGKATFIPSAPRVFVNRQPAATLSGQWLIAGCAFNVSGKPQPCLTIKWTTPAARVSSAAQNVVTQASSGICLSAEQAPQGPAVVTFAQVRTKAL